MNANQLQEQMNIAIESIVSQPMSTETREAALKAVIDAFQALIAAAPAA